MKDSFAGSIIKSNAMRDCAGFLETLDLEAIKMMLSRPFEATTQLGFELAQKFYDAKNPNAELILAIAFSKNSQVRE